MSVLQQSHRISQDLTKRTDQPDSLDFDDIQHFLMSRPPARAARYEFLAFRSGVGGRAWLAGLIDKVGTVSAVGSSLLDARWVTVGFTWNGLQTLGLAEASYVTHGTSRRGIRRENLSVRFPSISLRLTNGTTMKLLKS